MADSTKGRATGRRMAATPARYRKEGHLGAAAGEGSSARGMLPGISGIPSALHTPDPSPPPARAATGAGSSGPPKMGETLLDIMRDEEVGGIGAGGDDVGGDDGTGGDSSSDHSFDTQHHSSNNGAATGSSARTALDAPVLTVVMEKGNTPSRAKSPSPTPQQSVASAMTQRSLKRNQNKPYSAWPVSLLQIAIQARGISGLSRERSSLVLEKALADVDKVCGRPSPYYADLEDKATGETPASKPLTASPETVEVPEALVMAVRSAIRSGASINPKKMMDWEENAYLASRVLEVIADEDRASGAGVTTAGRRKSKHCVPRAVELMVTERFRELLAASRTQLSRTELDNTETGNKRSVYFKLWKDFKDTDVEVVTHLNDDEHITAAQIDPNIVHQPDISYDKFMNMVKEVNKDYGDCHHNMKKSGSHDEWYSFCRENLDTYYFGQVMAEYPQILAVCDRLLPEDVQRQSSGVGGAAAGPTGAKGAAADAKRREESKRRAREDNAHLKAKKKQAKNAVSVQETAAVAMHSVASGLGLPPGGLSELFRPASEPAPAAAPSPQNIVDEKTAKLRFFDTLFEAFQAATKNLKQAKAEAAGGDSAALEMVGFLEKKIAKIRTEMAEWDKSPL